MIYKSNPNGRKEFAFTFRIIAIEKELGIVNAKEKDLNERLDDILKAIEKLKNK